MKLAVPRAADIPALTTPCPSPFDALELDGLDGADPDATGAFVRPLAREPESLVLGSLEVRAGPGRGMRLRISRGTARIGRAPGCALCLPSTQVSRVHCELQVVGNDVMVVDLDSRNGVLLNEVRVHSATLVNGDLLQVGDVLLRFAMGA
jgi:hypothetical protein